MLNSAEIYRHRREVVAALRAGTQPPEPPHDTRHTRSPWDPIRANVAEALAIVKARRAQLSAQAHVPAPAPAPAPAPVALSVASIYDARRAAVAALSTQVSAATAPAPAAAESRRLSPADIYAARRKAMNATPAPRAFAPAVEETADEEI